MSKYSYRKNERDQLVITGNLEAVLETLKPEMQITGIVLEELESDNYLIRVRGRNILTKSEKKLSVNQRVTFRVKQIEPHLILALERKHISHHMPGNSGGTDLLI
ncbi:MAG: hypothetical protein GXO91_05300 [FCB group bacterium]|nr:hypothetical protein [FCB group bacterium]